MYFAPNLKALRKFHCLSQRELADHLHISRASLAKYEGAAHEPAFELLVRISRYFKVSTDMLLTFDLSTANLESIASKSEIDNGMMMPIQVDKEGDNRIEIIPHVAKAGYKSMYSDPGFIESLGAMDLPFSEIYGKCRAFPIEGDSMPPILDGSYVIARHISSRDEVKEGYRYIFLSREEGIVFKRLYLDPNDKSTAILQSDNPKYDPYSIKWYDIMEVWEFVAVISFQHAQDNYSSIDLISRIDSLKSELEDISKLVRKNSVR